MIDFHNLNAARGSVILVHSSISRTLKSHSCSPDAIIASMLESLGPQSTLLLPLFNFDFTRGTPFDIATTPSQMGALTEAGRNWPGAVRTGHPIYSFVAIGARAPEFDGLTNRSGYGPDSPFAKLRDLDGFIGVIDLPDQHSMTFYHHVEEMLDVPYRFHKDFTAPYTGHDRKTRDETFSIFVRDIDKGVLTSVDRMGERLWDKGLYSGDRPSVGSGLRIIKTRALFDEVAGVIEASNARDYLYEIEDRHDR